MNRNRWMRQTHRWLSILFSLAVLVNLFAVLTRRYTNWLGLLEVFPLALLWLSGLYLHLLPYTTKWRNARR